MSNEENHKCITHEQVFYVRLLYTVAVVVWIFIIYIFRLISHGNIFGYFVIPIPIVIFALGFLSAPNFTPYVRSEMLRSDMTAIALLFITILFNKSTTNTRHNGIVLLSAILILLSIVDVWTGEAGVPVSLVLKSILRTLAMSLLIYALLTTSICQTSNNRTPILGFGKSW